MTATAINNKYRPLLLAGVVGQDAVIKSLRKAVKDNLGNAYLFTGPPGTGKTTIAYIVAAMLGCKPEDVLDFDAATKTGIDDIREVIESLMYRPLGAGAIKAVIIDEAHALSKNAVTAMLKSLENPPDHVRWFLCTSEASKIPAAVKRRCLAYALQPVKVTVLIDLLANTDEGKDAPDWLLEICAEQSGGSPGQALANLGVCAGAADEKEAAQLLQTVTDVPAAFDLAKAMLSDADWPELKELLAKLKETNPESARHVIRAYMTSVMLGKSGGKVAERAFDILEQFATPFNSADGMSPLVLACGRLAGLGR